MTIRNIFRKLTFRETYKFIVIVTMKSGVAIKIRCDSFKFDRNNNSIITYNFDGLNVGDLQYLNMDEIAAIQYRNY